jgi:DNA-binding LacI/PurR family transcriptional regulator
MKSSVVTIKDIAEKLKVSPSTVSRALGNHPRIGLKMRMQVQALAREMGYEPNSQAISFKQKRTSIIGVILPFIREDFFSSAISAIEMAAIAQDYTILFGQSLDDPEQEKKIVAAMKKQRVDGLIISLSKYTLNYEHLASLNKYGIPVVYFDRVPPFKGAHKVFCNIHRGTVQMVNWLLAAKHRRIALINGPDSMPACKERLDGYMEAFHKKQIKVDMQLVETTDLSSQQTSEAVARLLRLKKPPTAIISFNDYVHMDAARYAQQQGVKVNEDIIFASYANLPVTSYIAFPPAASLEQFPFKQGEKAMELIIRAMQEERSDEFYTEEILPELVFSIPQ